MATKKVTQLTTATSAADSDLVMIVDVDDTTMSPDGTNKQITKANLFTGVGGGIVESVKISLDNADILALHTTPILLKAAEATKIIVPVSMIAVSTYASGTESSSNSLYIGWDASSAGTSDYWAYARQWMNTIASGTRTFVTGGQANSGSSNAFEFDLVNKDFEIWANAAFNGGWSLDVYFSYYMQDE